MSKERIISAIGVERIILPGQLIFSFNTASEQMSCWTKRFWLL